MDFEKPVDPLTVEIEDVSPTPREMRPVNKGWGVVHWACVVPTYAPMLGLLIFGFLAIDFADGLIPPGLFGASIIGTWAAWLIGGWWYRRAVMRAHQMAPTGGLGWRWTINESGLRFDTPLQDNRIDWRGIKSVREEKDRILFLVTPMNNPVLPKRLLDPAQLEVLRRLIDEARASGRLGAGVD